MKNTIIILLIGILTNLNENECMLVVGSQTNLTLDWWQDTVFYQINPRSFMDSDGDGIGDINGIIMKLPYFVESGIGAIWLTPIFKSPMIDFGYDITDFKEIHYEYGTLTDFDNLLKESKRLGIRLLLDLVPNHTSDECEWFLKSIERHPKYDKYYIWHDGVKDENGTIKPPNNWRSVFYGSPWQWNDKRGQYYFHQFAVEQPDLNFRNPDVVKEMNDIMIYWLDKGIDGFRIDATTHLYEAEDLHDEPLIGCVDDPDSHDATEHYYTKDMAELYDLVYIWRKLLDDYQKKNGGDTRVMLTEAYCNITSTMKYYTSEDGYRTGSHVPFNFKLIKEIDENSDARDFLMVINKWFSYMPNGKTANWVLGSHDELRVGTRVGTHRIDSMNILIYTLPGIGCTYNGEEIGMIDYYEMGDEYATDPGAVLRSFSRDPVRTPFQWDDTLNAGFSTANKTWLPVHSNYKYLNLKMQRDGLKKSHYKLYRELLKLRKHQTMRFGNLNAITLNKYVLAYLRELKDHETFVILINFGDNIQEVNLKAFETLSDNLMVVAAGSDSIYSVGNMVAKTYFSLVPGDGIVLKEIPLEKNIWENYMNNPTFLKNIILLGIIISVSRWFSNRRR